MKCPQVILSLLLSIVLSSCGSHGADIVVVPLPSPVPAVAVKTDAEPVKVEPTPVASPVAAITKPENITPGGLIKLRTENSVGTSFAWAVPENLPGTHYEICNDGRLLCLSSATSGSYSIAFFATDGKATAVDTITIKVGDGETPKPAPTPDPNPIPTPQPVTNSLAEWIVENAPKGANRESLALAEAYEKTANMIRDTWIGNGAGARGVVRNESLDALLAISQTSVAAWRPTLDALFDEINKRVTGLEDVAGYEKYFREAAEGFRKNAQLVQQGQPPCTTNTCTPTTIIRGGYPTNTLPMSRPLPRSTSR